MRIAIIGAGAMGLLFGIRLGVSGLSVTFYRRPEIRDSSNDQLRYQLQEMNGEIVEYGADPVGNCSVEVLVPSPDVVWVCTKTYAIDALIQQYRDLIEGTGRLVLLQNGIQNEAPFLAAFPGLNIVRVITSHGALRREPGLVHHTGEGKTVIGQVSGVDAGFLPSIANVLVGAGFEPVVSDDIRRDCWEKVFVNVGINAFGALCRLPNGELLKVEALVEPIQQAVTEAWAVARAAGILLQERDFYLEAVYNVMRMTAANQNSMLGDVLHHKPTEIDYINGSVVRLGQELGIPTPVNSLLVALIKGLERAQL
jgi:2-dehydropantoate 2-reductase